MSADDPYKEPPVEQESPPQADGDIILQSPRTVEVGRGLAWIFEAFHLFRKAYVPWITTGLIHFGLGMLAGFVPYLGGPLSTIVSTVIMGGIILGVAAQEFGDEYSTNYVFMAASKPQKLIVLSLVYTVLSYTIVLAVLGSFGRDMLFGGLDPETLKQQMELMRGPILVTALLLIPVIMASWFSIVLIVLHNVSVVDALRLSFFGCLRNLVPMFVLSLTFSMLFLIGTLVLFIGVIVVYPIMLISTYTAYRDIFTHEQVGAQ